MARLCAGMSATVLLRVPGAAVSVDLTPRTRPRHPLRKPRPLALAAPCPLPSKHCGYTTRKAWQRALRTIQGASKRGKPLREGRLWRSRRKAGRAARSRWVDDEAARGTRSPTRFAPPEALSAAAHSASTRMQPPRFDSNAAGVIMLG